MVKRPILVTGATGFTGGALARRLLRDGQQVRVLARESRRAAELVAAGAEVLLGDLRDSNSLAAAMADASVVYHVAASFRDAASAQELHEVNAIGTQSLLEAAINADVERFVHCSTIGVHGDVESPPADETAPFRPGDAYQASKLAAEQIVRDAMRDNRLPISIFRPGRHVRPSRYALPQALPGNLAWSVLDDRRRLAPSTISPTSTTSLTGFCCAARARRRLAKRFSFWAPNTRRSASSSLASPTRATSSHRGYAYRSGQCTVWPPPARRCARRSAYSRRCSGAASTSSASRERSTSRKLVECWDSRLSTT